MYNTVWDTCILHIIITNSFPKEREKIIQLGLIKYIVKQKVTFKYSTSVWTYLVLFAPPPIFSPNPKLYSLAPTHSQTS